MDPEVVFHTTTPHTNLIKMLEHFMFLKLEDEEEEKVLLLLPQGYTHMEFLSISRPYDHATRLEWLHYYSSVVCPCPFVGRFPLSDPPVGPLALSTFLFKFPSDMRVELLIQILRRCVPHYVPVWEKYDTCLRSNQKAVVPANNLMF